MVIPLSTQEKNKGFTLLEMMVAVAIFSTVILMVIGVFSRFTKLQQQDIAQQQLQEDLRIALDSMNRELRTSYGSSFEVSGNNEYFYFRNEDNSCVRYGKDSDGQFTRSEYAPGELDNLVALNIGDPLPPCTGYNDDLDMRAEVITDKGTRLDRTKFFISKATFDESFEPAALITQGVVTYSVTAYVERSEASKVDFESSTVSHQVKMARRVQ